MYKISLIKNSNVICSYDCIDYMWKTSEVILMTLTDKHSVRTSLYRYDIIDIEEITDSCHKGG